MKSRVLSHGVMHFIATENVKGFHGSFLAINLDLNAIPRIIISHCYKLHIMKMTNQLALYGGDLLEVLI